MGLFLLTGTSFVFSQTEIPKVDSSPERAIHAAQQVYINFFIEQLELYNGVKYNEVLRNPDIDRGHPFFISENLIQGTILHNYIEYSNTPLQYDIITDQIITVLPNTNYKISLIKDQVQSFTLLGHHFVNLKNEGIAAGFYELLFNDKVKVLAKRTKKLSESSSNYNMVLRKNYFLKSEWYVFNDNQYFLIRNKKALILVFEDQEQKINSFVRTIKTSFKKDREKFIVQLATYYNSLN